MSNRIIIAVAAILLASPVQANHVPTELDTPVLWLPLSGGGYLEFIEVVGGPLPLPIPVPTLPPGFVDTEEHTGFLDLPLNPGVGVLDPPEGTPIPQFKQCATGHDCDLYAGDRADFDWVQETRTDELAGDSNHPNVVGSLGWTIGTTNPSPHFTGSPGAGAHGHSLAEAVPGGFPELALPDFVGVQLGAVDVFSITSAEEDAELTTRDQALDYRVWFVNSSTGSSTVGIPVIVFVPGWTLDTAADNYVARWVPSTGGRWDLIAIDEAPVTSGHDGDCEIDAVVAATSTQVPALGTPATAVLMVLLGCCALLALANQQSLAIVKTRS